MRSEKNIGVRPENIGQQEKKVFIKKKQTKTEKHRVENWGKNIVIPCWFMVKSSDGKASFDVGLNVFGILTRKAWSNEEEDPSASSVLISG